jgi:hypothetical protein
MEKKYFTPEMEITEFETEDVITTSVGIPTTSSGNGESGEGNWGGLNG